MKKCLHKNTIKTEKELTQSKKFEILYTKKNAKNALVPYRKCELATSEYCHLTIVGF